MSPSSRSPEIDPQRAGFYAGEVTPHVPRLLSQLDREPPSASYGSFDRDHWGWKFRDFPLTMLQSALHPLALLWRFPFPSSTYYRNPRLLQWITAAIENTCRRQRPNGAFDSVGPHTQDYGVTLAMAHCLSETRRVLGDALPRKVDASMCAAIERGGKFALVGSEDYAFISNHQALFALAFLNAHELLGVAAYRQRAESIIEEILRRQSPDGWYCEYEGPDPGYESLGIWYLATYWQRAGSTRLLDSLRRSVEFFAHCVHPDGSVGGVYGSRHTQLYFPAGFELLAEKIPLAAGVARFMRERLARGNVLTPGVSDAANLPILATAYLESCFLAEANRVAYVTLLPCEALEGIRHFGDSGISVAGTPYYYAVLSAAKGGVCRIFDKRSDKVAWEDAGYVVRANGRAYTSQRIGQGRRVETRRPNEIACTTRFCEVRQELLTPVRFLVLRLLNLTVFRSVALGVWFRRRIINRLITGKRLGSLTLDRSITFKTDEIRFCDCLKLTRPVRVDEVALPRSYTAIHMGSAKYFHPSELESTPELAVGQMTDELNRDHRAQFEFALRFHTSSPPELFRGPAPKETHTARTEVLLKS